MNKIAVDTNILLYAIDNFDTDKQNVSIGILSDKPSFCSQALSEFSNVCLRKWKFQKSNVAQIIKLYLHQCDYNPVDRGTLNKAFEIMDKYDFQLFDSIIIASALTAGCCVLYTEDMQHRQVIEEQLTITNPFLA